MDRRHQGQGGEQAYQELKQQYQQLKSRHDDLSAKFEQLSYQINVRLLGTDPSTIYSPSGPAGASKLLSGVFNLGGDGSADSRIDGYNALNVLITWIGSKIIAGVNYFGAWFKILYIGGTDASDAPIVIDGGTGGDTATFRIKGAGDANELYITDYAIFTQDQATETKQGFFLGNSSSAVFGGAVLQLNNKTSTGGLNGAGLRVELSGEAGYGFFQGATEGTVEVSDDAGGDSVSIRSGTTASASAGAGVLPATPEAFLRFTVNGNPVRVPYYLP